MKRRFRFFFISIFLTWGLIAHGQQIDSLIDLSFEELMNVTISTASKQEESLRSAGAIISVITAKEIESYGALSLGEILDRATSMYLLSGYTYRDNMLSIRGSVTVNANTNILILINGRPFRESLANGMSSPVYASFPVDRIDHIEIIRGPGSILYGTCALTGVVNIITKKAAETPLSASLKFGTFDTQQANISSSKRWGKVNVAGALTYLKSDGWRFASEGQNMDIPPPSEIPGEVENGLPPVKDPTAFNSAYMYKENTGADLSIHTGNFKLSADYVKTKRANMGVRAVWLDTDYYTDIARMMVDAGYEKKLAPGWKASLNATYNHLNLKESYPDVLNFRYNGGSNDYLIEFTNYISAIHNLNILAGGLINYQTGNYKTYKFNGETGEDVDFSDVKNIQPQSVVSPYDQAWWGFYVQGDYRLTRHLKLIAGVQANKVTGLALDFVPRMGSIINFTKHAGLKLLYAKAFRSPSQYERKAISIPDIISNPDLGPEKIGTFETQLFAAKPSYEIYLTYFNSLQYNVIHTELKNIQFGTMTMAAPRYVNSGEIRSSGYEMEGKAFINKTLSLNFSATYQSTEDVAEDKDVFGMPRFMAKAGISYASRFGLRAGVFNSYFGKGKNIADAETKMANPAPHDFNYLSANIQYELSKLLKVKSKIHIGVYITNLLNEDIYYQEFIYRRINSLPGRGGRSVNTTVSVRF